MSEYVNKIIEDVPMLSKEDQLMLVKKAQNGDMSSRDAVIMSNLRFIRKQANYYAIRSNVEFDDLFQEGILGCIAAIETYDFKKNYQLSSHIGLYVNKWILSYCETMSRLIRIPVYKQATFNKIKKEIDQIGENKLRKYSYQQLAKILNITVQDVIEYMMYQQNPVISTNTLIVPNDDKMNEKKIEDILQDSVNIPQLIVNKESLAEIEKMLDTEIDGLDAEIFKRKFGLDGYKEMNELEICYELRLPMNQVNESLRSSMARLRSLRSREQEVPLR